MRCMPISQLTKWVVDEKKNKGTVFGVHKDYKANNFESIFDRKLETPIGPAAGPNSQLAQNIIASYYAGARFFELKTVQEMDGPDLAACVNKPCILADDECYNCEWSTELYVWQAYEEYVKAWFVLHVMAKEYGLGLSDGFQFNISVGYNLEDIKKDKTNDFINNMMEAKDTKIFKECKQWLLDNVDMFEKVTAEDIEAIPSNICNSATLSTLHGCPPQEIEAIATYLLQEKNINTFIKCNPTLLGYEFARNLMDSMNYDYVEFGSFHFEDDLQYKDAIPMFKRLIELSEKQNLSFGVKITNTFPVDVKENQLPSEEMYMSGKSLYPLSISLAAKLAEEFDGKLRISYSGGADFFNIDKIVEAGIWPVTVATTLLKPGGYNRFVQLANKLDGGTYKEWSGIDVEKIKALADSVTSDGHHVQSVKELPSRKSEKQVPLIDCFTAPCQDGCPIHQNITKYVAEAGKGDFEAAFKTILDRNPLPFITGKICAHPCMTKCTRNFYEENVNIRATKLYSANMAYEKVAPQLSAAADCGKTIAVVGGGTTGIAAAHYLARAGAKVTIFEKEAQLGGTVANVIPDFRIDNTLIQKDIDMMLSFGVEVKTNTEIESTKDLAKEFDYIVVAIGASNPGMINVEGIEPLNAIAFLKEFNKTKGQVELGKNVVVIGGGNTAMDVARSAKRNAGVENVNLVYRRTKRFMPADQEELELAIADGVGFMNLLSPAKWENGKLICEVMELSEERDASGRRKVVGTGNMQEVDADSVIVAVGEKVDTDFYKNSGMDVTDRGFAKVTVDTNETSIKNVFVVGDGLFGPATVVKGMANAKAAAEAILGKPVSLENVPNGNVDECIDKKGILIHSSESESEAQRCLNCNTVCENCVDVCPNRANISIEVPGLDSAQVIHVDYMCNECGNCKSFCPYSSAPYLDKFTLFASEKDMSESNNEGFCVLDSSKKQTKVRLNGREFECDCSVQSDLYEPLRLLICSVIDNYPWLLEMK